MPLYLAMVFSIMRKEGLHEGCIDQIQRMFSERLYNDLDPSALVDDANRLRLDDLELREDVQLACRELWPSITTENLFEKTDYQLYKDEFLKLFGFGVEGVDYDADVESEVEFDVITL
jgi:enoyl-[acyl-carrier protein] reductase/trans-2-enoyl-CoA reductase (NAD+)